MIVAATRCTSPSHRATSRSTAVPNRYSIGASIAILPLVLVADCFLPPDARQVARALAIAAIVAKVLAAASVALLFALLVELTGRLGLALGLALAFAFATVHFPIHAGGLFTHNVVVPILLSALWLLVWRDGRHAAAAAIPFAAAFATRPTCAPVIALASVYVARHRPRAFPRYALAGAAIGAGFVGWSLWMYGTPLPPYYVGYDRTAPYVMSPGRFAQGLLGHLVSPNRGVFVFTPILVFSVWGMALALRSRAPDAALYRLLALAVVAHWVLISLMARRWWAGWSFGPRHVVEIFPLLVVLLVPAIDALRASSRRVRAVLAPLAAAARRRAGGTTSIRSRPRRAPTARSGRRA